MKQKSFQILRKPWEQIKKDHNPPTTSTKKVRNIVSRWRTSGSRVNKSERNASLR